MRHPHFRFLTSLETTLCAATGALLLVSLSLYPARAQFSSPDNKAPQVYEKIPDFPLENQYRHRERRKVVTDNTLIKRLIQYHVDTKGRSPLFRLDWKITLAEYLGLNGYLDPASYPGRRNLKPNPVEADQEIIQGLNRASRNQLIQALVDVFAPVASKTQSQPATPPSAVQQTQPQTPTTSSPTPQYGQEVPRLPQPGAASGLLGTPSPTPKNTSPQRTRPAGDAQLLLP